MQDGETAADGLSVAHGQVIDRRSGFRRPAGFPDGAKPVANAPEGPGAVDSRSDIAALTTRALVMRTPAAALRVAYHGEAPALFRDAHLARDPQATVAEGGGEASPVEVVATTDLGAFLDSGDPSAIEPGGFLIAALDGEAASRLADLAPRGFEILQLQPLSDAGGDFDDEAGNLVGAWREGRLPAGPMVVVARRGAGPAPLHL
ncbi:MAG TPA: hypothetical protein VFH92_06670, partial [Phenylobacterium sp.]|nr:hypothetical protein [Phenylobacterium sp.]